MSDIDAILARIERGDGTAEDAAAIRQQIAELAPQHIEVCGDCGGRGHLGRNSRGQLIACESCGGHEDALGTGTESGLSPAQRIADLERELAAAHAETASWVHTAHENNDGWEECSFEFGMTRRRAVEFWKWWRQAKRGLAAERGKRCKVCGRHGACFFERYAEHPDSFGCAEWQTRPAPQAHLAPSMEELQFRRDEAARRAGMTPRQWFEENYMGKFPPGDKEPQP